MAARVEAEVNGMGRSRSRTGSIFSLDPDRLDAPGNEGSMLFVIEWPEEVAMRAWTVDADDIRVAEDFDDALLHRTPWIDGFLARRDQKFIVTGTKGFGKTLLLKAKRMRYQPRASAECLPRATCSTSRSATRSSAAT